MKLRTSEAKKSDIDTEAFVASLLEKPEVNVVGASRGPMGHVIKELFSKQEVMLKLICNMVSNKTEILQSQPFLAFNLSFEFTRCISSGYVLFWLAQYL